LNYNNIFIEVHTYCVRAHTHTYALAHTRTQTPAFTHLYARTHILCACTYRNHSRLLYLYK